MLKPQPAFAGRGGHGRKWTQDDLEDVSKLSANGMAMKLLGRQAKNSYQSFTGGIKAGIAGMSPKSILPSSQLRTPGLQKTADVGAKIGQNYKPIAVGAAGGGALVGTGALINKSSKHKEMQAWEAKKGKWEKVDPNKVRPGKAGDLVAHRAVMDRRGRQQQKGALGLSVAGLGATIGGMASKTRRGAYAGFGGGLALSGSSMALSHRARSHTGTQTYNPRNKRNFVTAPAGSRYNVDKKARTYDSELNRQRRQGMYIAGGATGAGALGLSAARDTKKARTAGAAAQAQLNRFTKPGTSVGNREYYGDRTVLATRKATSPYTDRSGNLQDRELSRSSTGKTRGKFQPAGPHGSKEMSQITQAERETINGLKNLRGKFGRKAGAKFGGAFALGGGSLAVYRHSRSNGNKRWN